TPCCCSPQTRVPPRPHSFAAMKGAEPAGADAVTVVAEINGTSREGEAWFRVDRERRDLEGGSEGPTTSHAVLYVTGNGGPSTVTVFLHTERHDSGDIDRGIARTMPLGVQEHRHR